MIEEKISRQINALIDWSAGFIRKIQPKVQEDHANAALFKSILMAIDSPHFKHLLTGPTSIRQLQLEVCAYFEIRFHQQKDRCLQGGGDKFTPMRVLLMFKLIFQLAFLTAKDQCMIALSKMSKEEREVMEKIINELPKQSKSSRVIESMDEETKVKGGDELAKVKEENKRLRLMLETFRINETELLNKNLELERQLKAIQALSYRKDMEVEEAYNKVSELENIIREISYEIFDETPKAGTPNSKQDSKQDSFNLTKVLPNTEKFQRYEKEESIDQYVKQLEKQQKTSNNVMGRFQKLKEIHELFKIEVGGILAT